VLVFDALTGNATFPPFTQTANVAHAAFSPDNRWLFTSSRDGAAHVYDMTTGREAFKIVGHLATVSFADFSPDGKLLVTASEDQTARVPTRLPVYSVMPPLQHFDSAQRAKV
jgi:WD40 repeat protein